ncbi:MAG: hypothetical protein FWF87_02640 [Synergistaceae bacterium]|nr:hypothetical protein [Synergistaceae bacterium]
MITQTKTLNLPNMGFIAALLTLFVVIIFIAIKIITATIATTTEESVSYPNPVIAIIMDLRNLRASAEIFRQENLDKLGTIKPDIKLLSNYMENPARFTKNRGEYIFEEVDGVWWVGCNLDATGQSLLDREDVCERLRIMGYGTIYGSMDINIPYYKQDIVFMRVQ